MAREIYNKLEYNFTVFNFQWILQLVKRRDFPLHNYTLFDDSDDDWSHSNSFNCSVLYWIYKRFCNLPIYFNERCILLLVIGKYLMGIKIKGWTPSPKSPNNLTPLNIWPVHCVQYINLIWRNSKMYVTFIQINSNISETKAFMSKEKSDSESATSIT